MIIRINWVFIMLSGWRRNIRINPDKSIYMATLLMRHRVVGKPFSNCY